MKSITQVFYTHKRTELILQGKGIKVRKVLSVSIVKPNGKFLCCVHVVYIVESGAKCSCFLSVKDYLKRSINKRKEAAKEYTAVPVLGSNKFNVYGGQEVCEVNAHTDGISCNCPDHYHQPELLKQHPYLWSSVMKGRAICKHIFSALNQMKFSTLAGYLKAQKTKVCEQEARDSLFPPSDWQQVRIA